MILSLHTLGKLLLAVNVLLTGGVIMAGGSFILGDALPAAGYGAFEISRSPDQEASNTEQPDAMEDFAEITVDKFLSMPAPTPKAVSAPSSATPVVAAKPDARIRFRVKGIMLSSVEKFTWAILDVFGSKEQQTVSAGDVVEGVEIIRIKTDCIVVMLGEEEVEVPLDISDAPGAKSKATPEVRDWRKNVPKARNRNRRNPAARKGEVKKLADKKPKPDPKELAKLPRHELIKRLPPRLQEWWATLSPKDKDRWEARFRKKYAKGGE